MSNTNGYYNIFENTFSFISTNKSVLILYGIFSSLLFSYNTFYNVNSTNINYEGGLYFILFYYFYFTLFYILLLRLFILIILFC
jgi:hypothetical protein